MSHHGVMTSLSEAVQPCTQSSNHAAAAGRLYDDLYIQPDKLRKTARLLSRGNAGHAYRASNSIAVKYIVLERNPRPWDETRELFTNEIEIYQILEKHPSPRVVRCLLSTPDALFLELIWPGVDLARYFIDRQERGERGRFIRFNGKDSRETLLC